MFYYFSYIRNARRWLQRNSGGGERLRGYVVYHELEIYLPQAQIDEIHSLKCWGKFFLQHLRVVSADAEGNHSANVTENGLSYFILHLFDILMRHGKAEFIFSRFRENLGKRLVGERLKLVHEEIKWRQ